MLRTVRFSGCSVRFENRTHNWKHSNRTKHEIVRFEYRTLENEMQKHGKKIIDDGK